MERLAMIELEADEMLFTGDMKEKLWAKCLDEEQHKQLIKAETEARIKKLDRLDKVFSEI